MSENLDKSNRKKDGAGRFESEINKDTVSRPLSEKEKIMIENFKRGKDDNKRKD